jgi:uncharacterized membrane protein HdeD (DUF308 family)
MPMLVEELRAAQGRWWLFLIVGALMFVLGLLAISSPAFMATLTVVVVIYVGILLLVAGAAHVVAAFSTRIGGGFFFHLLAGVLDAIIGLMMVARPDRMLGVLTALLAVLFLVGGLFRAGVAVALQPPRWGLMVLSGLLGVALGVFILIDLDENQVWVIGLLVGVELVFRGISWVITSLALRQFKDALPGSP